jgi:hypothetical protein
MFLALVGVSLLAAIGCGSWVWAELDLRATLRELAQTRDDLQIALGWTASGRGEDEARTAVVLHAIDGGRS